MNEQMWQLDDEEIRILAKFTYDCLFFGVVILDC
jgi:hypothetical protein